MTTSVLSSRASALDDASLARRHLQGDPQAFGALVDRYQACLSTFVDRTTGDGERAEDLVQEIFIRVFRHLRRFDQTKKFSTWLYAIALHVATGELRKRNLKPPVRQRAFEENGSSRLTGSSAARSEADCVRLEAASPGSSSRW
jgi:RNA polymerase sigma-70 factor (ECF subfamily)